VVRESALESLAENLNDSFVAPLFWFCLGGLPGAALYRFANTADAMYGLRGRWEWAGKWAARADDVLSYVPARLTALLLAIVALRWPGGLSREAQRTASPNGGWPMGMLALALDVRLSRPGYYVLHAEGHCAGPHDISRGLRIAGRAAWSAVVAAALVLLA
jgi:adenosylcobinamide-phosphate synthase